MAATGAGCGGKKDASATTTTVKTSTTSSVTTEGPTTTLTDAEYAAFAARLQSDITAAGSDPCKVQVVLKELSSGSRAPATPQQLKVAVELVSQMLTKLADSAPASLATEAQAVREAGPRFAGAAQANGYSIDWFHSSAAQSAFGPSFFNSFGSIQAATSKECKN
jgi:hypothetical protein